MAAAGTKLLVLAALWVAGPAHAQLSAAQAPVSVSPQAGTTTVRWPDVAFGSVSGVFLAISGAGNIFGQYFSPTGAALGAAFVVNDVTMFGQAPRVAYSPDVDGFLVAWHESIGNATRIRGRIVRHGKTALTGDLDLSPLGTNWEMGAAMAYSPVSQEFLLGWQAPATSRIQLQRLSSSGALLGSPFEVEATLYARDPAIGFDPVTNRFLVAYGGCVGTNDCFIHAQRVQAGTGALVGTTLVLDAPITAGYVPELAWDSAAHRFFAVWYRVGPLYGRTIDGATLGPLVSVSPLFGSYDANSVAYNPASNTFVVVTHSNTAQDLALEVSAAGQTLDVNGVRWGTGTAGNFNPRIAASGAGADWLAVTSNGFGSLTAQRLTTLTRPPDAGAPDAGAPDAGPPDAGPPDAGALDAGSFDAGPPDAGSSDAGPFDAGPDDDGGASNDAGTPADAGSPTDGGSSRDAGAGDGGVVGACGCTGGASGAPWLAVLALLGGRSRTGFRRRG